MEIVAEDGKFCCRNFYELCSSCNMFLYYCNLTCKYNIYAHKGTIICGTKMIYVTIDGTPTGQVLKWGAKNKIRINQVQHKNCSSCMC